MTIEKLYVVLFELELFGYFRTAAITSFLALVKGEVHAIIDVNDEHTVWKNAVTETSKIAKNPNFS